MKQVTRLSGWLAILVAGGLAACSSPPPPPPPTVVNVTITGAKDVNADPSGSGAPVAVRVYQLASTTGFTGATFFPIFEKDAATLKDDLAKREDILLAPGQTKTLKLTPDDKVHAIGVFAAYRDYEHVTWHGTVDVPPNKTSDLTVTAGKSGLELAIAPSKTQEQPKK